MPASVELSIEQNDLTALGARLAREVDGKKLRLVLIANLRSAVAPAVAEIKAGALSIKRPGSSAKPLSKYVGPDSGVSLGACVARGITTQVRLTGRAAGVSVKASKKGMPRNFPNAPKRLNAKSFRHKVFGRKVWVVQIGAPEYFDRPLRSDREKYRAACIAAMQEMSARIAAR